MESVKSLLRLVLTAGKAGARQYPIVLASVVVCVSLAVGFAIARGPLYSSEMTLKGVDDEVSTSASTIKKLASASGLGGMAGGNGLLPAYIDLLQSKEVAALLMNHEHFERVLFADHLNPDGTFRGGLLRPIRKIVYPIFGIGVNDRPTVTDVQNALQADIVVNQDQLSGLVTVGCTSTKPALCRELLLAVHREAEHSLAQSKYDQAVRTRDYILSKFTQTMPLEVREAMQEQLTDAQNRIAMSGLERPVAALIVDPPRVPDEASFPKPPLIALLGLLAGIVIGLTLATWKEQAGPLGSFQWRSIAVAFR